MTLTPPSLTPLFPLGSTLYPDGALRLQIFEVRYLDMIRQCIAEHAEFGVVGLVSGREVRTPEGREVLASAGTLARIDLWDSPMPGLLRISCTGTTRFRLRFAQRLKHGLWVGDLEPIAADPVETIPGDLQQAADTLGQFIADLQKNGTAPDDMPIAPPYRLDECAWVADRWSELLPLDAHRKERLLVLKNPVLRLALVHELLLESGWIK
jgi:Lon protease-like protein